MLNNNALRSYLKENKTLINIFLVYFFLTFALGYIDFDRRVESFSNATAYLEEVVKGEFSLPMARRVLVPYTVYFFHKVSHLPLDYTYALFRFIFYFITFMLFHIYLRRWFDDKVAMIGTLSVIASLPLTLTNFYSVPTDMPELITFILGAMFIKENRHKALFFLIPIATLNRETSLALVLLYFLNGIGRQQLGLLMKRTSAYFVLWFIPFAALVLTKGTLTVPAGYFLGVNTQGMLRIFTNFNLYNQYYFWFYLCGFYWILAFRDFRRKDRMLKRAMAIVIAHFLFAFLKVGAINEVRMFIPFYVFIIPLGLFSLFENDKTSLEHIKT